MKSRVFSGKISILISFVAFFAVLAVLLFAAYPLQMRLGNAGLVITELLVLGIAFVGCAVTRQRFSEMFPMKIPEIRQVFGALAIWLAMYLMSMAAAALSGILMPDRFIAAGAVIDGMSLPFKLFSIVLLPAICEEMVHRGLITHFLKPIKHRWIIILIIGVQFGLLHWEPVKFLSTGIAGACLVYVLLKSKNMVLCFLMHMLTNLPAAFVTGGSADFSDAVAVTDAGIVSEITLEGAVMRLSLGVSAGMFTVICAAAPWLIYAGSRLLSAKGIADPCKKKKITVCTVTSCVTAAAGIIITVVCFVMLTANIASQIM